MKHMSSSIGLLLSLWLVLFTVGASAETLSSRYCIVDLESWNRYDTEDNHYVSPEDFVKEFEDLVEKITSYLHIPLPEVPFQVSFVEGTLSLFSSPDQILLNAQLLQVDWLPIAHELTHGLAQNAYRDSLSEGLSCYMQNLFGNTPDHRTMGFPVHSIAKQYLADCDPAILNGIVNGGVNKMRFTYMEMDFFYLYSYSFVKFLIDTNGIDRFRELYFTNPYIPYEKTVLHKTAEEILEQWLAFIKAEPDLDLHKLAEEGNPYAKKCLEITGGSDILGVWSDF